MRATSALRYGAAALALGAGALLAFNLLTPTAQGQPAAPPADAAVMILDGRVGFVVTDFGFALSEDANLAGACPNGMTRGLRDAYMSSPEGQRRDGETDEAYSRRIQQGAREMSMLPNGQNVCMNPEAAQPDPQNFRPMTSANVRAYGIDLDGQNTRANGAPAPGMCAQTDFTGVNGARGIDNQFLRVVGCSNSYRSTGQSWDNTIELRTGSWGVLISLSGVDDLRNDPEVEVGIHAAADPIQLSPAQEPLRDATYAPMQDARFRAVTRGRVVDGVLSTDPVDVRLYKVTNSMYVERPLRDARLQVSIAADGAIDGYLAGYAPVEAIYDHQYGFRSATDGAGQPSPLRLRSGSANGNAFVNNHTCNGVYHALYAMADGHRDPASGRCTTISTQYRIKGIPAFIVDAPTRSANDALAASSNGADAPGGAGY